MSNLKIIAAYNTFYLNNCRGFVSNYIDNGDGTFKCTVQREIYDSSPSITNTEETLIGIKNIYDLKSHNLPTQLLLMSSDHNIFIPQKINEISIQEYLGAIYIVLYIAKKYSVLKTGTIYLPIIVEPKNKDSTYDSIPFDTDENKAKKYIYGGYLIASDARNNGYIEPKRDELYWKNTANLNLSLYKLLDSSNSINSKFCLKINSTRTINDNLKVYDCSSNSSLSPDITIMPDIESAADFLKKNMTYLVLGTIGVVVLISICCSVSFMFMKKGKKRKE